MSLSILQTASLTFPSSKSLRLGFLSFESRIKTKLSGLSPARHPCYLLLVAPSQLTIPTLHYQVEVEATSWRIDSSKLSRFSIPNISLKLLLEQTFPAASTWSSRQKYFFFFSFFLSAFLPSNIYSRRKNSIQTNHK